MSEQAISNIFIIVIASCFLIIAVRILWHVANGLLGCWLNSWKHDRIDQYVFQPRGEDR